MHTHTHVPIYIYMLYTTTCHLYTHTPFHKCFVDTIWGIRRVRSKAYNTYALGTSHRNYCYYNVYTDRDRIVRILILKIPSRATKRPIVDARPAKESIKHIRVPYVHMRMRVIMRRPTHRPRVRRINNLPRIIIHKLPINRLRTCECVFVPFHSSTRYNMIVVQV